MACYHPVAAYRTPNGVAFSELRRHQTSDPIDLACGHCIGCRLEQSRQWATRCIHEAQMHTENEFVTLTYAPEHLPPHGNLRHRDYQLFMKRLRKKHPHQQISYYMCGEYGEQNQRPHYHACLFGIGFKDKALLKGNEAEDSAIYTSHCLTQLWPLGHSSTAKVNFRTAAYVARYVMQKVTGDAATKHYHRVDQQTGEIYTLTPEYNRMSLNPAIGKRWLEKYHTDVYPHGTVVINSKEQKPPRYYDKELRKKDEQTFQEIKTQRELTAYAHRNDHSNERLAVQEQVTRARLNQLKRKI